jgi:hypothetical protein
VYFALVLQLLVQTIELEAETFLEAMKDLEFADGRPSMKRIPS